ncbi:MAG: CRISPR-associated endoribonuclease Cas6 [Caldisericum sp.]
MIKEAISITDEDYKRSLYDDRVAKHFTFSVVFPCLMQNMITKTIQIDNQFTIEDKVIICDSMQLYISSIDYRFMINLYNGLMKLRTFDFSSDDNMLVDSKRIVMHIKKISTIKEIPITTNSVLFKTNSPILIEDKNDKPVLFTDPNFEAELNEITNRRLLSIKGERLRQPLKFEPLKMKKEVVKHTLKKFREHTGKPFMYLTGSSGVFKLSGHPHDLETLYQIGIGNRTGQGFGMVELICQM